MTSAVPDLDPSSDHVLLRDPCGLSTYHVACPVTSSARDVASRGLLAIVTSTFSYHPLHDDLLDLSDPLVTSTSVYLPSYLCLERMTCHTYRSVLSDPSLDSSLPLRPKTLPVLFSR